MSPFVLLGVLLLAGFLTGAGLVVELILRREGPEYSSLVCRVTLVCVVCASLLAIVGGQLALPMPRGAEASVLPRAFPIARAAVSREEAAGRPASVTVGEGT